jgi:hypothetical protein
VIATTYDGRDDVVSSSTTGENVWWSGDDQKTRFVRDGLGRALTVSEGCVTSSRLYDGLDVVAEGDTQLVREPSGRAVRSDDHAVWPALVGSGLMQVLVSTDF